MSIELTTARVSEERFNHWTNETDINILLVSSNRAEYLSSRY